MKGDFDMRSLMRTRVKADIEKSGWHVTGVFATEDDPVRTFFCYTVGLWEGQHHPELLTFGLRPEVAHGVFDTVRDRVLKGERFRDGQMVNGLLQGGFAILFHAVPNDDDEYPTNSATAYYGHRDYEVLQLVLPDMQNRFPWQIDVDPKMALTQQLLGPIVAP